MKRAKQEARRHAARNRAESTDAPRSPSTSSASHVLADYSPNTASFYGVGYIGNQKPLVYRDYEKAQENSARSARKARRSREFKQTPSCLIALFGTLLMVRKFHLFTHEYSIGQTRMHGSCAKGWSSTRGQTYRHRKKVTICCPTPSVQPHRTRPLQFNAISKQSLQVGQSRSFLEIRKDPKAKRKTQRSALISRNINARAAIANMVGMIKENLS